MKKLIRIIQGIPLAIKQVPGPEAPGFMERFVKDNPRLTIPNAGECFTSLVNLQKEIDERKRKEWKK